MKLIRILRMADLFYALANNKSEKLPDNSRSLSIILKNIENLDTHNARKKYAEMNLKHLSSGSSRIVYKSSNGTIIKLAKNDKGIAQNEAESNPKMKSDFLNKILKHAKNFSWIETFYLDKITEKDFEHMTKLQFSEFGDSIRYALKEVSESSKSKPKNFDKISKCKIYKEMKRIGEKFKLMPGDIARISSWGTKNNKPVLIDAGLTKDIFDKFYES